MTALSESEIHRHVFTNGIINSMILDEIGFSAVIV